MSKRSRILFFALSILASVTSTTVWYSYQRRTASQQAVLVAEHNAGNIAGVAPVRVEWVFRNTGRCSWRVTPAQEHCRCVQVQLNSTEVPPGGVLMVRAKVDVSVAVTPEESQGDLVEQVVLPFLVRSSDRTYRLVGTVRGRVICPLIRGPSFIVAQFQDAPRVRTYSWRFHPQLNRAHTKVSCTLPQACASLKMKDDSLYLTIRPLGEEKSCEGSLRVYDSATLTELLRIPVLIRMSRSQGG